ncbi:hypothetical protein Aperf_G00000079053 [Anoplocephala perfoliata]
MMDFGDLKQSDGLKSLDDYLLNRSYIEGYQPSKSDCVVFDAIIEAPDEKYRNVLRWYNHIKSYGEQRKNFPGEATGLECYGPADNGAPVTKEAEGADDDFDLFGSDDEAEVEKRHAAAVAAYNSKKADKPVAKSMIILDVKPWDDETDMAALEESVRSIQADGLLWGTSKLVPVVQGVKKLQITCVVEDDKVGTDFLEEEITKFDQYVQSVDIASFNKL